MFNGNGYGYVIIKENDETFSRLSTLLYNKYKKSAKYVFIQKNVNNDGSENIAFIDYSSNLDELQNRADKFVSWYNYVTLKSKNIQGYVTDLP